MALLGNDLEENGEVLVDHLTIIDGQRLDEYLADVDLSQSFDFLSNIFIKEVRVLSDQCQLSEA